MKDITQTGGTYQMRSSARAVVTHERRHTQRIQRPLWAKIRGKNGDRRFEVQTIIDNLGAGGFYVRLLNEVEVGANVFGVFRFFSHPDSSQTLTGPCLAVRGSILRVEPLSGGVYGVAVRICRYRFI